MPITKSHYDHYCFAGLLAVPAFLFLLTGCGERLSAPENRPPELQPIPGQIISPGASFNPVALDLYVQDEADDSLLAWSVTTPEVLSVDIQARVAFINLSNPQWRGMETLTFTATDPEGLSSSTSAIFGVTDPAEGEIVEPDGRLRILWQSPEVGDGRVLYWLHNEDRQYLASRRGDFGTSHDVQLLELASETWYDYFAFSLDTAGDTLYQSPQDSFITGQIQPAPLLRAHFIDVKQGDACLVQTAGGFHLLVDGGYGTSSSPSPPSWDGDGIPYALVYLQSHEVQQVDLMVKTHDHSDHYGGLADVLDADIPVIEAQAPFSGWGYASDFAPGDVRMLDESTSLKVLNSGYPPGISTSNENNSSLALKLIFGEFSLLLTGDAETPVNSYLLEHFPADLPCTVLKVNHHGSSDATTSAWLSAVSPAVAIISCGAGNPYGHPHESTLTALSEQNIELFRTDLQGDITVSSDGSDSWVWVYSP